MFSFARFRAFPPTNSRVASRELRGMRGWGSCLGIVIICTNKGVGK
jgi:hypothetical protein